MKQKLYAIKVLIILGSLCIPSIAFPFTNLNQESSIWDNLIPAMPTYPGCSSRDYYWYDQSGPDTVIPTPIEESQTLILNAERIMGQESNVHYALGDVVAYKDDKTIQADWLFYDQKNARATGGGNVILTRQFDTIRGTWMDYYINANRGVLTDAKTLQGASGLYAEGKQIRIFNKDQFLIENGSVTSCDPNNPEWLIRARQVDFDYQDSSGIARGLTFYVESVPVLKVPYFNFPLGKRKSGFLFPEFGYIQPNNVDLGFLLGVPYYWNIAPNYDATITPKIYTKAGLMVTGEFRYLMNSGKGKIYTEQMPNSYGGSQKGYRYYWHLVDTHTPIQNIDVGYTYNAASDNNYFNDFGNFYSTVDNINLERSVYARYRPSWGLLGVIAKGYQTLQPTTTVQTVPIYASLPQVNFNVNPLNIATSPIKFGLISQYSSFGVNNNLLQTGQRTVVYPSLTAPIQNMWGFIRPKIGFNYTNYQLAPFASAQNTSTSINRNLPVGSVDTGLIFERNTSLFSSNYTQTVEPRLYYLYIPSVSQNNIPAFDTATASYNINQLFSENRFAGFDRVNAANDLTVGANTRLINDDTGAEVSNLGIGYRQYLASFNNLLYGSYQQFPQLYQPQPNLIAELSNKWARSISSNAMFQYDTVYNNIDLYAIQLRYNPGDFKVINARFSYQYNMPILYAAPSSQIVNNQFGFDNQYALDVSGQWPLFSDKWLINARTNYDFTKQRLLNGLAGLEYNGGCWSMRLVYARYITNVTNYTDQYLLQFQLKGLASIGSDLDNDMRINIPGYMPIVNKQGFNQLTNIR